MILKYLNGTPKKINELLGFYENRAPHGELIGIPTHLVRSASRPLKAPKSIPGRGEAVSFWWERQSVQCWKKKNIDQELK